MMKKTILLLLPALMVALTNLSGTALASEKNFIPMSSPTIKDLTAVWGTAANDVYAVGYGGIILHYDGTNWSGMTSGTTATLTAIWGTSSTNVFAVGYDYAIAGGLGTYTGKILRYNGNSWSTMATFPNIEFTGVGGVGSYVYACGQDHTIGRGVIYLKEGWDWTRKYASDTAHSYHDIWGYQPEGSEHKFTYFAGDSEIVEYRPELINPAKVLISGTHPFLGIWGSISPTGWDIVAVGGNPDYDNTYGDIRLYDFTTKNYIRTNYEVFLFDVWGVSNSDLYAVGGVMDRGRIIHYDGTGWKDTLTSTNYFFGVWGSSSADFFVVGRYGTILRLNIGPNKPSIISPANGATNVSLTPVLQSSAFTDPNSEDTHATSQWQITSTPGSYSSPVYDSGTDTANKISLTVPGGTLAANIVYYWRVRYQDNNGAWSDWSNSKLFTTLIPAPTITSIDPVSAAPGDTISVVITGDNFGGASELSFPGMLIENFTVDNPTQITVAINIPPDAVDGPRDVSVTTPGGIATLTNGFFIEKVLGPPIEVPIPTLTSLNPVSAAPGDTMSISIAGSNFNGATEVDFGQGINVDSFNIDTPSQITTNISVTLNATVGTRDISVTTPGGTATLTASFTIEELLISPPEPEPEPEPESKGIPGFPIESSIISLIVVVAILLMMRKRT